MFLSSSVVGQFSNSDPILVYQLKKKWWELLMFEIKQESDNMNAITAWL